MASYPSVSVVICTRDRIEHLNRCISSLLRQSHKPKEIIVVDDASPERFDILSALQDAFSYIKRFAKLEKIKIDIKCIRNRRKQGIVKSRNIGVAAAKGDVIAFIDDDGYAHKDWIRNITKHYENRKVVGVGGSVIETGRKVETKPEIRRLSYITSHGDVKHHYRIKSLKEIKNLRTSSVRFLMGGNMSFRRDALIKINGFDPKYKGNYYREETDLCLRISKMGKIIFEPGATAYHTTARHGGTRDVFRLKDFLYWYFRNTSLLFMRHFNLETAIKKVYRHAKRHIKEISEGKFKINRDYLIVDSLFKLLIAVISGTIFGILIGLIFDKPLKRLLYKNPEYVIVASLVLAGTTVQILDAKMLKTIIDI